MHIYRIRLTDSFGVPRIVTVTASTAIEALRSVEPADGEIIEQMEERE